MKQNFQFQIVQTLHQLDFSYNGNLNSKDVMIGFAGEEDTYKFITMDSK